MGASTLLTTSAKTLVATTASIAGRRTSSMNGTRITGTLYAATSQQGCFIVSAAQRSFMSTQPVSAPEDDSTMILLLSKPGGGKGTISNKILSDFPKFHHLSTGDLLRQHVRDETPLGLEAKKYMDKGKLVPDDLMVDLVMQDATPHMEDGRNLLLDGFPRTLQQAISLEKVAHVDCVINLDIPTETIVDRISDRWIHPASGRVYSYSYNPPKVRGKDDITGEDLVQRDDDKPECVRKRLTQYEKATAPLVHWYDKKGVLRTFSGTLSDVIYPEVKRFLLSKKLD